jgi:cellulose synthase/poly-beta-1,6-N-acetylglucosamine synthase-like glycosyltransferase
MSFAAMVSVGCLAVLIYLYVGYPAVLQILARIRPRPVAKAAVSPSITVVIPAHNEADVIEEKVRNTLASDYPTDRLEVLVVSDGSTDGTGERVRKLLSERSPDGLEVPRASVRILELPRGGKGLALNAGARVANGKVLVFTDANTSLAPDALRRLVANFADPEVGGVCGDKRYGKVVSGSVGQGEGAYWRYDRWIKGLESRIGSIFASDGALHAVRAELFRPIQNPASADDMAISMRVVLEGYRLVYERDAVVREDPPTNPQEEFRRKVRITNHSMRALLDLGPALWTSGFYSVELLSHKFIRHLSPLFLAGLLASSAVAGLAGSRFFLLLFAVQLAFYSLAALGRALDGTGSGRTILLAAPYHFTLIQLAASGGILSLLRGRRLAIWAPRGGGLEIGGTS